jgi:hypothetical protein
MIPFAPAAPPAALLTKNKVHRTRHPAQNLPPEAATAEKTGASPPLVPPQGIVPVSPRRPENTEPP